MLLCDHNQRDYTPRDDTFWQHKAIAKRDNTWQHWIENTWMILFYTKFFGFLPPALCDTVSFEIVQHS